MGQMNMVPVLGESFNQVAAERVSACFLGLVLVGPAKLLRSFLVSSCFSAAAISSTIGPCF